jgi:gliding motility-associated-like protein
VKLLLLTFLIFNINSLYLSGQNSIVGDGFGGRSWYSPSNYSVGSYSGYYVCFDSCSSSTNQLYGWGGNDNWQFGFGTSISGTTQPLALPNLTNVKYASAGYMLAVIKNDNTGWISGSGMNGPSIQVISDTKFVDACSYFVSFVKNDGSVWSSGTNVYGGFGDGFISGSFVTTPVQMQSINNAVRVACNVRGTIILLEDSTLMSVGNNEQGHLGLGPSVVETLVPMPISGLPKIIDIKSNAKGTIALSDSGYVYSWGKDSTQFSSYNYSPILIQGLDSIIAISGCDDGAHFLALDENGNCFSWGSNVSGQCGQPINIGWAYSPMLVATDIIDIMAGEHFSYLIKADGTLWVSGKSSSSGSIWLNLTDYPRYEFTLVDHSLITTSCQLNDITVTTTPCSDSLSGSITVSISMGQPPYSYSVGNGFQDNNYFDSLTTGFYDVLIVGANGCEYFTSVVIDGENCPTPEIELTPFIEFPNIFTPNGDCANDHFGFNQHGVNEINCKILNRWGNLIISWDGIANSWDGLSQNGAICSEGVFYYIVNYRFHDSEWKTYHGHVTLVR